MKFRVSAFVFVLAGAVSAPLPAQKPAAGPPAQTKSAAPGQAARTPAAPLPAASSPVSSHAPFEAGDCKVCHQSADPKQPGPLVREGTALCLECHEEFAAVLKRPHTHFPARTNCTSCHNPHNAAYPKLMQSDVGSKCLTCHDQIKKVADNARVPHRALTTGVKCANCHNPHASSVAKLLIQKPFELCLSCHNRDSMADSRGRKLQNIKAWLDSNKVWHGPVASEDCSACHEPHGGDQFRLLRHYYPPDFYAPYDPQTYALCFSCHREEAFSTPKTTTLTGFRNGATNLHYVHLQQGSRGRTCRACHEVHASRQALHIRDGVPYGSSGWMLKLNYKKTPTGGSCEKTCHQERSYSNRDAR